MCHDNEQFAKFNYLLVKCVLLLHVFATSRNYSNITFSMVFIMFCAGAASHNDCYVGVALTRAGNYITFQTLTYTVKLFHFRVVFWMKFSYVRYKLRAVIGKSWKCRNTTNLRNYKIQKANFYKQSKYIKQI